MSSVIHIVAGPTASGKSSYAMNLAATHCGVAGGVLVNCDSLQIYDGLPILTAQPSDEDKRRIPHRLYGVLQPDNICSAGHWRELAVPVIKEIFSEGQTPVVVGGTGLYIKALIEGLSPMPDIPPAVRQAARVLHQALGPVEFYQALHARDPVMADRLGPGNSMRLIRAWEVLEFTGRSLAAWQSEPREGPPGHWDFKIHKIMPDREVLNRQCDTRLLQMMEAGVLDEVAAFAARIDCGEIHADVPLTKALGFRVLRSFLRGESNRAEAVERAQTETRQYAKRQMTWFRHQL